MMEAFRPFFVLLLFGAAAVYFAYIYRGDVRKEEEHKRFQERARLEQERRTREREQERKP